MLTLSNNPMMAITLPAPRHPISIREATMADIPFIDALQKIHKPQVGFMYMETLEEKIALKHVLVAEDEAKHPVGYCIGNDKYLKREELGVIYHMNVVPQKQRSL